MKTPNTKSTPCLKSIFLRCSRLFLQTGRACAIPLAALVFAGALTPNIVRATNWLQYGGNPQKDNVNYAETSVTPSNVSGLKQVFSFTMGPTDSVPVVLTGVTTTSGVQDLLFVTDKNGVLYAINAQKGTLVWKAQTSGSANNSSPCVDPNLQFVYLPGADGFAHKYHVGDGSEVTGGGWPEMGSSTSGSKMTGALGFATDASGVTRLYIEGSGFGNNPYGHMTAVNLADGTQHVFNTVCSNLDLHIAAPGNPGCAQNGSGVWSRPGFMYDPATNLIYVATAEFGKFNPAGHQWSQSVLALNPACTNNAGNPVDSFTPTNYAAEITGDIDQGSGNGSVMPDLPGSTVAHVVMTLGKDAHMRLHDATSLSGHHAPGFVGGELSDTLVPQGGENFAQPSLWHDPDGSYWLIVPTTKGISGLIYTLDSANNPTLQPMWKLSNGWVTGCEVANGIVFGANSAGSVFALNVKTGAQLWSATTGSRHWAGPIEINGMFYVTDGFSGTTGHLTAFGLPGGVTPPPPNPPTNLGATSISSSQINLTWTASTTSPVTYNIFSSTTPGFTPSSSNQIASGVSGTTYSDTGLVASTTYYYAAEAVNSGGASSPSNEANATTMPAPSCTTVPSAPTGLAATATSSSQIDLSWTASTSGPGCSVTYDVYSSTTSGFTPSSANLISSGVTGTSFSDNVLTASTTYYYLVVAVDSVGSSSPSNQASATTQPPQTGIAINSGGPAASPFLADEDFAGGATINHANTIDTSKVTNPAPAAVYQSARVAATAGAGTTFSYTIGGFTAGSSNTVRLHFCETFHTTAGSRVFNVSINGTQVLTNFDIFATAGGQNIANIQQFTEAANASGQYVIAFTSVTDKALISGIEIGSSTTPPPPAAPAFSPAPGSYSSAQSVTISDTTTGASIFYTTDGSTPTTSSTLYTSPVSITATTTLQAIANAGSASSSVTSGTYTITFTSGKITLQAGSLTPTGSGQAIATTADAAAPGGTWVKISSTAVGQWIQFTTPSIPAGTYSLSFIYRTNNTRAQHNVTIDGTQVGTTIVDQYAATSSYPPAVVIGSVTFATAGTHTIRLTATGKNAASTDFQISAVQFIFQ